jgi:hypothetical protein
MAAHIPASSAPRTSSPGPSRHAPMPGRSSKGRDGRFYFYAPVLEKGSDAKDKFAIGVAVADRPTGPWTDAHPSGPIVSQKVPVANDIQNIDPTVLLDDDGRVYLYWGTFGRLRGMELERDMVTPKGPETQDRGADRLLRGAVDPEAQGRVLHALRRQQGRAGQRLHAGGLPCLPGLRHGDVAARAVDLSRRRAAAGLLDHFPCRNRRIQGQVVHGVSHCRRGRRRAFPPQRRDR